MSQNNNNIYVKTRRLEETDANEKLDTGSDITLTLHMYIRVKENEIILFLCNMQTRFFILSSFWCAMMPQYGECEANCRKNVGHFIPSRDRPQ